MTEPKWCEICGRVTEHYYWHDEYSCEERESDEEATNREEERQKGDSNMREIKFRAWDKRDAIMIYPKIDGGEEFMLSLCLRAFEVCHGGELIEVSGRYELLEFTGLNDKQGKEIYEGDLVVMQGGSEKVYKIQWSDEWNKAGFVIKGIVPFANKRVRFSSDYLNPHYAKSIKITGNIYENPKLLKDNK